MSSSELAKGAYLVTVRSVNNSQTLRAVKF
jgi:hypothetical protein